MRFRLIDRLEAPAGARIRGRKLAAMGEDYFEHHFPERAIVPGVLILQAAVELAGWQAAAASDFTDWLLLTGVESARYYAFAAPGDTIDIEATASEEDGAVRVTASCHVAANRAAEITFVATRVPLADLIDPAEARRRYAELRGEREA